MWFIDAVDVEVLGGCRVSDVRCAVRKSELLRGGIRAELREVELGNRGAEYWLPEWRYCHILVAYRHFVLPPTLPVTREQP